MIVKDKIAFKTLPHGCQLFISALMKQQSAWSWPVLEASMDNVAINRKHLTRYSQLCRFALEDHLPPLYPQIITLPLQLALLCHKSFPFSPLNKIFPETGI